MDTLRNLSRVLNSVNGSRKAVLFFSEGIDYDITDVMGTLTGSRYASDVLYSMRDAIGAATRSNVAYLHHRSARPGRHQRRRDGHGSAAAGRDARIESLEHPR